MKVYVIVEILHSHALGTIQELVSQAFATEELAEETMKLWRSDSYPDKKFDIRELELKFGEDRPIELKEEEIVELFDGVFENYKKMQRMPSLWERQVGRYFFLKGYKAAIAERAKFDEINGLIVKDIGEL